MQQSARLQYLNSIELATSNSRTTAIGKSA